MDRISRERRSANMAAIRGRDTGPELVVRRILRRLGAGYRLHLKELPGSPDIVMQGRRKAIFVHGCFWHRHKGCRFAYEPKSRRAFWRSKFAKNVERDARNAAALRRSGWDVMTIWECETTDTTVLEKRIAQFLGRTLNGQAEPPQRKTVNHSKEAGETRERRAAART